MYVCLSVCLCLSVSVCMRVYVSVCLCVCVYVCLCVRVYFYVCLSMYACLYMFLDQKGFGCARIGIDWRIDFCRIIALAV